MSMKKVIYVASRYSDGGRLPRDQQEKNRKHTQNYALRLWHLGYALILPLEIDHWAWEKELVDYETILNCDFALMLAVHKAGGAIFFCPNSVDAPEDSGVKREFRFALAHRMEIMTAKDL